MSKPTTTLTNPRRVVQGTVIQLQEGSEVVREVSIVLHMANGQDLVFTDDNLVSVLTEQPQILPESEVAPLSE